ncbi:MAG TPA: alpha/beta hydrolase [Phycisphaerae bacterium]|nr:alpha/beta hydrolase [Phycisphaerae bacterium]
MRRFTLEFTRAAAILAFSAALLAACSQEQLMPTPNLYATGQQNPFPNVPPEFRANTVDVLYLTDRIPLNDSPDHREYGYGRSRSMAFGISQVKFGDNVSWDQLVKASTSNWRNINLDITVPKTTELGRFQPTPRNFLQVPGSDEEKKDDADQLAAEKKFTQTLSEMLSHTPRKEVYLSIHGVNNQHIHSVSRIAQIWHFFGREGVPIAYSWPAGSPGLKQYMYDRESSEFTVYHLKQALKLIAACPDVQKVNIISHSRGTDVLATALRELHIEYVAAGKSPRKELKLGTVVLAAPDMDLDVTLQRCSTAQLGFDPERFVLYVGKEDKLLRISNWLFGGFARLGGSNISTMFSPQELAALQKLEAIQIVDSRITDVGSHGHDYFVSNPAVSSDLILSTRDHLLPGADHGRPLAIDPKSNFWVITDSYPTPSPTTAPAK